MRELDVIENWMRPRPSLEAVLAMAAGSLTAFYILQPTPFSGNLFIGIALVLSFPVFVIKNFKTLRFWTGLIFFLFGIGATLSNLEIRDAVKPMKKITVHATIKRLLSSGDNFRVLLLENALAFPSGEALPGYGRLMLRNNSAELSAGDRVSFRSPIRKPSNRGNPGEYDWEMDCLNEGIVWLASTRDQDSLVILNRAHWFSPSSIIYNIRQSMISFIDDHSGRYFRSESSTHIKAILKGMVMGDRGDISPELNRSFSDSGLVHAFSASGVHVTIVGFMAFLLVRSIFRFRAEWLLKVPLPISVSLATIPVVTIYCVLVGFKPPSMRAAIMGVVLGVSVLGQKRWDSFNTLAVASLFIMMIYPLSFMTPSFQLSFAAVAGIIMMMGSDVPWLFNSPSTGSVRPDSGFRFANLKLDQSVDFLKRPFISVLLVTVSATIATSPIVAQLFQRIPTYGIFANLLAEFPLSFGLAFGLIAAILSCFSTELGAFILFIADVNVWIALKIADFFSSLPYSVLHIPEMGWAGLLFSIVVTILFFSLIRMPSRKTLMGLCLASAGLLAVGLISYIKTDRINNIQTTFFNVGNGDTAFVKPPQNNGLLVDGGPATEFFNAGQSIIVPFLMLKAITRLDAVVLSHPQSDHYGGLCAAVKQAPTNILFMNQINNYSETLFKKQISGIQEDITFRQADRNSPAYWIGDCKITFINAPAGKNLGQKSSNAQINDSSSVMRIDYFDFSILFLGDLEKTAEKELLESGENLRATVLKVAHHAGKTSATSAGLLEAIQPRIAIISADYPSRSGIPSPEVVDRLKQSCANVYWTGRDGAITITSSGSGPIHILLGKSRLTETVY